MPIDAAISLFAVVFTVFLVAVVVLLVLVLRFIFQRAAAAREDWLAAQAPEPDRGDAGRRPITALVLAGGGIRGAVQIGMLQVLAEHGFVPDRIYGSSVGAINGAAFAGDPSREGVGRMTEIWLGLSRDDVFPQGRLHGPWLYLRQRESVYANTGLRTIIEDGVRFERLEDATVPIEIVATSLTDGREHWFTHGPVAEAVLASTALPAIFPPVEIDGERFIDGGVVDNVPILRAAESGATRIVALLCTPPSYAPAVSKRPAEAILNALLISIHARFARDLSRLPPGVEVIVCSGTEFGTHDFDDFSNTEAMIVEGRKEAAEIVRRYGLGSSAPARPPSAPAAPTGADGDASERGGTDALGAGAPVTSQDGAASNGSGPGTAPANGASSRAPSPNAASSGSPPEIEPPMSASPPEGTVSHPEPGT